MVRQVFACAALLDIDEEVQAKAVCVFVAACWLSKGAESSVRVQTTDRVSMVDTYLHTCCSCSYEAQKRLMPV